MPTLTLTFKNKPIADYQLEKGRSVNIGRRKDNDVIIENLAVSGHHAKIESVGDGFVFIDLQSKNGSFVNERLINSHWLKNGDVINIGKHALIFSYPDGESRSGDYPSEMEKTMIMDTNQYRSMMEKSEPNYPKPMTRKQDPVGSLAFLAGGEGSITLSSSLIKIGKDSTSDIVVKGLTLGKTAATISKRPDGYYLSYVGGFFKPKVNDQVVKRSIMLKDLDIIDFGATKLQFFEKE